MRVNCTNLTNEAAPALLADRYGVTFTSTGGPVDELAYLLLAGTDHWDPDEASGVVRQVVNAIGVHGHAAVQRGSTHRTAASPDGPFGLRAAFWAGWRVLLADGRYFLYLTSVTATHAAFDEAGDLEVNSYVWLETESGISDNERCYNRLATGERPVQILEEEADKDQARRES